MDRWQDGSTVVTLLRERAEERTCVQVAERAPQKLVAASVSYVAFGVATSSPSHNRRDTNGMIAEMHLLGDSVCCDTRYFPASSFAAQADWQRGPAKGSQ